MCMPCKRQAEIIDGIRDAFPEITFTTADRDQNPDLAEMFGTNVPQLIYKVDGKIIQSKIGLQTSSEIISMIKKIRNNNVNRTTS